jgi:hypothetical protein
MKTTLAIDREHELVLSCVQLKPVLGAKTSLVSSEKWNDGVQSAVHQCPVFSEMHISLSWSQSCAGQQPSQPNASMHL